MRSHSRRCCRRKNVVKQFHSEIIGCVHFTWCVETGKNRTARSVATQTVNGKALNKAAPLPLQARHKAGSNRFSATARMFEDEKNLLAMVCLQLRQVERAHGSAVRHNGERSPHHRSATQQQDIGKDHGNKVRDGSLDTLTPSCNDTASSAQPKASYQFPTLTRNTYHSSFRNPSPRLLPQPTAKKQCDQ